MHQNIFWTILLAIIITQITRQILFHLDEWCIPLPSYNTKPMMINRIPHAPADRERRESPQSPRIREDGDGEKTPSKNCYRCCFSKRFCLSGGRKWLQTDWFHLTPCSNAPLLWSTLYLDSGSVLHKIIKKKAPHTASSRASATAIASFATRRAAAASIALEVCKECGILSM